MSKRRRSKRQTSRKRKKNNARSASACLFSSDESSSTEEAGGTTTEAENLFNEENSGNNEPDNETGESAVLAGTPENTDNEDMVTPLKDSAPEMDDEYGSDDEQTMVGPCGDVTFGCDPSPISHQKLLGKFITLEFDVEDNADLVLYTGEVTKYIQATDKFEVSMTLRMFLISVNLTSLRVGRHGHISTCFLYCFCTCLAPALHLPYTCLGYNLNPQTNH